MLVHEGHLVDIMALGVGWVLNQRGALDRVFIQENTVIRNTKIHMI